jgi:hypothetical protein
MLDLDGQEDIAIWISALEDEFEPLVGVTNEDDDDDVRSINATEQISKTSHRDVGSSLEVMSRPTLELDDAKRDPSISALQSTMFPKEQSYESVATQVVEAVRTKQVFEGDGDWEKIDTIDEHLPVYDGTLLPSDVD